MLGNWTTAMLTPHTHPYSIHDGRSTLKDDCHHFEDSRRTGCNKPDGKLQWFLMSRVALTTEPDGEWVCPSCL